MKRRFFSIAVLVLLLSGDVFGLNIVSLFSPRNRERPKRARTDFIILHTTEGPKAGSLKKVRERGETHYFVDRAGHVYRIIHRDRIAYHAGRSMWNGLTNLDRYSVGIEIVGYHDQDITDAQYHALAGLVKELQRIYRISDDHVLTHSMVAYGTPNRWHRRSHRGRKRCGMLFAVDSVRSRLGLTDRPRSDPDVAAGRLVVADAYLASVLYGGAGERILGGHKHIATGDNVISSGRSAWDIARDKYASPDTTYILPDGRRIRGNEVRDWKRIPPGTRVVVQEGGRENEEYVKEIGKDGGTATEVAGEAYKSKTTIYFFPDKRIRRGDELTDDEFRKIPAGTKVLVGYVQGGLVTSRRSAFDICGARWNISSTFYRFPNGAIYAGNRIREKALPSGTHVFYRN